MRAMGIVVLLALSGCEGGLTQSQRDAVTDIAGDAAADAVADDDTVAELQERVDALEDRLNRANIPE